MRKVFILLLMAGFSITACKKEEVIKNKTIIEDLDEDKWEKSSSEYSYIIKKSDLDDTNNGVLVYVSFDNNTYEQLPIPDKISFKSKAGEIEINTKELINEDRLPEKVKIVVVKSKT